MGPPVLLRGGWPLTLLAGFATAGVVECGLGATRRSRCRGCPSRLGAPPGARESTHPLLCCRRPRGVLLALFLACGCLQRLEGAAEDRPLSSVTASRVWAPHVAAWGGGAALWVCAGLSGFCTGPSPESPRSASPCSCVSC